MRAPGHLGKYEAEDVRALRKYSEISYFITLYYYYVYRLRQS